MSMNIGFHCIKYCFFGFNIIFWALGCGCLGVGVWLYVSKTAYLSLAPASYGALSAAGLCIAAGATVVVVGFVGCCGAWVESKCLLLTYFVFVLLVFVIETTAGVLGFLYRDEVREVVRLELHSHLNSQHVADSARDPRGLRITWDHMQQELKCCGVDDYRDWFKSTAWPLYDYVPDSCCLPEIKKENCGKIDNPSKWFNQGCYKAFTDWLLEHMHIVGVFGLLFAFIQTFGLVSSMILFCGLRERETSGYRYQQATPLADWKSNASDTADFA